MVMDRYLDSGRWMVMGVMVLLGLIARRRSWSRYELCAACQAMFLVIAPGFGVQYTVLVVPMLCALLPGMGLLYGTGAGAFSGEIYWHYRVSGFPIASRFTGGFPEYAAVFGLVVWMILIVYLVRQLRPRAAPGAGRAMFPPIPSTAAAVPATT
jgi:hypothetical protein